MAWDASRKQFVAGLVLMLNPLHGFLKKWSYYMPEGWEVLPYLINFLIVAVAVFFICHYASPRQKFSLWLIPFLVVALALNTYLSW